MSTKTWLARSRASLAIFLLVPACLLAVSSPVHFKPGSGGEIACNTAAIILFLVGAFWRWWSTLYIGGRKGHELISTGPYSMCRNPLYFGTFLITMSLPVVAQSLTLGLALLAVAVFYLGVTVPGEERRLLKRHGKEFEEYHRTVPIFIPNFRLYKSPANLNVLVGGLHAEFWRSLQWIAVPILCQVFLGLRMQPWWPQYFLLP